MDSSSWPITEKKEEKKNEIYFDKKQHAFLFLFFKDSQTLARGPPSLPPSSFPSSIPLLPPFKYDVILKCMRLRNPPLQGFYDFIVPLYVVSEKKNLADLVCTEVPERLHFGFKKIATE